MVFTEVGSTAIRGENINRAVKGFALRTFKLKQVLLQQRSRNWTETYYKEFNTILTAGGNRTIQGVSRGALPPEMAPSWEKTSGDHIKFMASHVIFYEDQITDAIDVQARTLIRIGEAVASSVDAYIYAQLTAATSTSGDVAAAAEWNAVVESTRDPIGDMAIGIAAIGANNYDFRSNGFIIMDNKDYSSLIRNSKVINNPSFKTADVVSNGVVGQILGGRIIVTEAPTTDEVMLILGQRAATWKSAVQMTSAIIPNPGINSEIRSWEIGQIQITDPQAIYTITGTQV